MPDTNRSSQKSASGRRSLPSWVFPGFILTAGVVLIGLFWFYAVVLNQFRNSNQEIDLNYVPAKQMVNPQAPAKASSPKSYIESGQYQKAIDLLEASIRTLRATGKEDSLLADNLQEVGKCYLMLNRYPQAEEDYREALRIYDKLGNSYPRKLRREAEQQYALVLKRLGQSEKAKQFESKED
jgi:tetratricopeptide (TPR) repeat protein